MIALAGGMESWRWRAARWNIQKFLKSDTNQHQRNGCSKHPKVFVIRHKPTLKKWLLKISKRFCYQTQTNMGAQKFSWIGLLPFFWKLLYLLSQKFSWIGLLLVKSFHGFGCCLNWIRLLLDLLLGSDCCLLQGVWQLPGWASRGQVLHNFVHCVYLFSFFKCI